MGIRAIAGFKGAGSSTAGPALLVPGGHIQEQKIKNWNEDFLILSRRKRPGAKESTCLNLQLEISMISQEEFWAHSVLFIFTWFSLKIKIF